MSVFILHPKDQAPDILLNLFHFEHGDLYVPQAGEKNKILFQWGIGDISGESLSEWVLNGSESLKNCNSKIWRELLPLQGINVSNEAESFQKKYLIYVFQLNAIGILVNKNDVWLSGVARNRQKFHEISLLNESKEVRKVRKVAIRSIHALGLDFGLVKIGVRNQDVKVVDIDPAPVLTKNIAKRLGEGLQKFENMIEKPIIPSNIILGADPEFVLRMRNGKFLLASRFFTKQGEVGCDQIWLRGDRSRTKLPIVELRPAPSANPRELVANIYMSLLKSIKKINNRNIEFLAGSAPLKPYPIGGHIHFSGVPLNSFLLRALDNYMALPCFVMEDPNGFVRRPKYGFFGDFREQFHGGFEYRTLPSWLVSPRITKGMIALAKVVAASYPKLRRIPSVNHLVQKAYYQGEQEKILPIVGFLWKELEEQPIYEEYRNFLDPLKEDILEKRQWSDHWDIRIRWKLPPYH